MGLFIPETPRVVEEPPSGPPPIDGTRAADAAKPQPRIWLEILAVLCFTLIPSAWTAIEDFIVLGPNRAPLVCRVRRLLAQRLRALQGLQRGRVGPRLT